MARLDQLFSTVGDGSGTTNMAAAADSYYLTPADNEVMFIRRINTNMRDTGKWAGEKYTAAGALATGIVITHENAAGVIHTFNPLPITTIGHWDLLAGVDVKETDYTTGDDLYSIRWTLAVSEVSFYRVDGRKGEFIHVNVQDSLAALHEHYMQVQGNKEWRE